MLVEEPLLRSGTKELLKLFETNEKQVLIKNALELLNKLKHLNKILNSQELTKMNRLKINEVELEYKHIIKTKRLIKYEFKETLENELKFISSNGKVYKGMRKIDRLLIAVKVIKRKDIINWSKCELTNSLITTEVYALKSL